VTTHPSLSADFNPPEPLRPRERMPVNEPCWCGSGKKWKECHRDRERQESIPIGKLLADHRAEMLRGYCLHPQAGADKCSGKIVQAHTVQRKGGLAAIAEDGHVISPKRGFEDIFKNDGKIVPRLHGVREASTFAGFCSTHDDQLFSPIEKAPLSLNREAAFLLSFRAICYEKLTKEGAERATEVQRLADKGDPFELQCVKQQYIHFFREGMKRGIRDLDRWKRRYDTAFLTGNYDDFCFYGVMFSDTLPIVSCGSFHPEFDFNGNDLQIITRGEEEFEHISFNLTVVHNKSLAVLGWTGGLQGPAERFVDSFKTLPRVKMANAVFHLACEHLENTYIRPSWWEAQSEAAREHLIGRFRSGIGSENTERKRDCLSRLEYCFATSMVDCELDSP
jgi:hypothetical protein